MEATSTIKVKVSLKEIISCAEQQDVVSAINLMLMAGYEGVNFESDLFDDVLRILENIEIEANKEVAC